MARGAGGTEEIPGNAFALRKLQEVFETGKATAFVGAGASAGLYPLWNELLRVLADTAVDRGLATPAERKRWLDGSIKPQLVAQNIRRALGDYVYGQVLFDTFRPRRGPEGSHCTKAHRVLMTLPFRGYVTTNYDPGLLEARRVVCPDIPTTGYATWKDQDAVQRWYTGDVFEQATKPILFAHGIYERSDTIVLTHDDYLETYDEGLYREVFERLFGQERLVFVGYGFKDPWLEFLASQVIARTARRAVGDARHLALIGLRSRDKYRPECRRDFETLYNASVYFYRIRTSSDGREDHSDLLAVLETLGGSGSQKSPRDDTPPPEVHPPPLGVPTPVARWVHETTEDDRYVGREDAINLLADWSRDASVRAVAVTGFGGLGKTALVGHWLKRCGGQAQREVRGVFFWSFYADRSVGNLFDELARFARADFGVEHPRGLKDHPLERARAILRGMPLLLVLDGLEVLQEGPGSDRYGTLMEHDLREFLVSACRPEHQGLVLLTSRFPFPDLIRYLGAGMRLLPLDRLEPMSGAELLTRCRVGGSDEARQRVAVGLEGHPLALRVFAAALATQAEGDPTRFFEMVFNTTSLREDERLEAKLRRLLSFYENHLPDRKKAIISLVSLFRSPVEQRIITALVRTLASVRSLIQGASKEEVRAELESLSRDQILLCERRGSTKRVYSCHPILRDHFRGIVLGQDRTVALGVAEYLRGRPASERPSHIGDVEPILSAIELLLVAGEVSRADELYKGRLEGGYLFQWLPAPHEGLRCALGFVADPPRRERCLDQLGRAGLSYYLNAVGLHGALAGELQLAVGFLRLAASLKERTGALSNLLYGLHTLAWACVQLGQLSEAVSEGKEAVRLANRFGSSHDRVNSLACCAHAMATQGRVPEAFQYFEEAERTLRQTDQAAELIGLGGVWWAQLLIRLGRLAQAERVLRQNRDASRSANRHGDVARCEWLLGVVETVKGELDEADRLLSNSESIMRRGQMLAELPAVLIARSDLILSKGCHGDAERLADDAFEIARLRSMAPIHADALVQRARVRLQADVSASGQNALPRVQLATVRDDLLSAVHLSRHCGYPWAERVAQKPLHAVLRLLGDRVGSEQCRADRASSREPL